MQEENISDITNNEEIDWTDMEVRQAFYHTEEWRNLREYVIANEPFCRACKANNVLKPAKVVDHIQDIQFYPELRLDFDNLQPLCVKCHNRKTGKTFGTEKALAAQKRKRTQTLFNRKFKI